MRRRARGSWRLRRHAGVPLEVVALAEPAVLAAYQRRLVLVRPDGHVAWRGDAEPAVPAALIDTVRGARGMMVNQVGPASSPAS